MTLEEAAGIAYGDHPACGVNSAEVEQAIRESMGLSPEPCPSEDAKQRIRAAAEDLIEVIRLELGHVLPGTSLYTLSQSIHCDVKLAIALAEISGDADGTAA